MNALKKINTKKIKTEIHPIKINTIKILFSNITSRFRKPFFHKNKSRTTVQIHPFNKL